MLGRFGDLAPGQLHGQKLVIKAHLSQWQINLGTTGRGNGLEMNDQEARMWLPGEGKLWAKKERSRISFNDSSYR